jgi:hypothetical protein
MATFEQWFWDEIEGMARAAATSALADYNPDLPRAQGPLPPASLPPVAFLGLSDTPSAYTGAGGHLVRVNAGATAVEFVNGATLYDAAGTAEDLLAGHLLEADPHSQYLTAAEGNAAYAPASHTHAFTSLTEVPSSFSTHGGKLVRVDAGATALEFVDGSTLYAAASHTHAYVDGTGAAGQVMFWSDDDTATGDSNFQWDNANKRLGVGVAPSVRLHVYESINGNVFARVQNPSAGNAAQAAVQLVGDAAGLVGYFGVAGSGHASLANTFFLTTDSGATGGILVRPAVGGVRFAASGSSANDLIVAASGIVYVGTATANSKMSRGLTINQAGFDDEILALQSSDVAHGITTYADTSTYMLAKKWSAAAGGAYLWGLSSGTVGFAIGGMIVTGDTTKSTAATAPVVIGAHKRTGTDLTSVGANENIVVFRNHTQIRFILDGDGDSHQDVGTSWTNFDAYDDPVLLHDLSLAVSRPDDPIREQFGEFIKYSRAELERLGLATFNANGRHFVNMSKLAMVNTGGIRQLYGHWQAVRDDLEQLSERLDRIERAIGL